MTTTRAEVEANAFISDDPQIRVRLAQLAMAFAWALLQGDMGMAHSIRGEAILLKLSVQP